MTSPHQLQPYTSVIMVRAKDKLSAVAEELATANAALRPLLLFLHSDAVELLRRPDSPLSEVARMDDIDVAYCTTAWTRRGDGPVPEFALASSLVQFWSHQLKQWRLTGDDHLASGAVLIDLREPQTSAGWKETLEVILAAATLDIPMQVRFQAPAWASLCGEPVQRKAWQQLLDFELASIEVVDGKPDASGQDRGVRFLTGESVFAAADAMRRRLTL